MNVLVITSTFPRSTRDDQVPWLGQLVRRLKARGVGVMVYAPSYRGLRSHMFWTIPVIRFRYGPSAFEILTHEEGAINKLRENPWLSIIAIFYLFFGLIGLLYLRRERFDVVHVHWPFPNGIFGILAKRLFGARMILTFHGAEFTLTRRTLFGASILAFILSQADQIIANSLFTRDLIARVANVRVHVIPFASAVGKIDTTKPRRVMSQRTFNILFVGRLIERKGVQYLIDGVNQLRDKNIPAVLSIVGNGPLREELCRRVAGYTLNHAIRIYVRIDNNALSKFYSQADVFVLPAIVDRWGDTEGLGVVLIEAMSFSIPVVSTRVGGIPSIIQHNKNGLLVRQKDPHALAAALEKLYRDVSLRKRLGENGYVSVRNKYNWGSIIEATMRLYSKKARVEHITPLDS